MKVEIESKFNVGDIVYFITGKCEVVTVKLEEHNSYYGFEYLVEKSNMERVWAAEGMLKPIKDD